MEQRKITIVTTRGTGKKVIMSGAETLAELKEDMRREGISYDGISFLEGISKTELRSDDAQLPKDVMYKNQRTNELVFLLSNTNKKIKSGAGERAALLDRVRELGLQDACQTKYGKNFTNCKSAELEVLISEHETTATGTTVTPKPEVSGEVSDTKCREALKVLVDALWDNDYLCDSDRDDVLDALNDESKSTKNTEVESSYGERDIDEMFADFAM